MTAENFHFKQCRNILLSDIDSVVFPLGSFIHKGIKIQGLFRNIKGQVVFCF